MEKKINSTNTETRESAQTVPLRLDGRSAPVGARPSPVVTSASSVRPVSTPPGSSSARSAITFGSDSSGTVPGSAKRVPQSARPPQSPGNVARLARVGLTHLQTLRPESSVGQHATPHTPEEGRRRSSFQAPASLSGAPPQQGNYRLATSSSRVKFDGLPLGDLSDDASEAGTRTSSTVFDYLSDHLKLSDAQRAQVQERQKELKARLDRVELSDSDSIMLDTAALQPDRKFEPDAWPTALRIRAFAQHMGLGLTADKPVVIRSEAAGDGAYEAGVIDLLERLCPELHVVYQIHHYEDDVDPNFEAREAQVACDLKAVSRNEQGELPHGSEGRIRQWVARAMPLPVQRNLSNKQKADLDITTRAKLSVVKKPQSLVVVQRRFGMSIERPTASYNQNGVTWDYDKKSSVSSQRPHIYQVRGFMLVNPHDMSSRTRAAVPHGTIQAQALYRRSGSLTPQEALMFRASTSGPEGANNDLLNLGELMQGALGAERLDVYVEDSRVMKSDGTERYGANKQPVSVFGYVMPSLGGKPRVVSEAQLDEFILKMTDLWAEWKPPKPGEKYAANAQTETAQGWITPRKSPRVPPYLDVAAAASARVSIGSARGKGPNSVRSGGQSPAGKSDKPMNSW